MPSEPLAPAPGIVPGVRAYFINMDASGARRGHMEAEFARCGLAAALPPFLQPYFQDADGTPVPTMTPGEIGCHAAHLAACRRFLADGTKETLTAALVLEDDITLPDDLAGLLAELLARLPAGWDIVRLSNIPKWAWLPLAKLGTRRLVRYSRVPNYSGAYLLSPAGAAKLLAPGLRVHAIDNYLRRPWLAGLRTYGMVPPPVGLRVFPSDIDAVRERCPPAGRWHRRWRRANLAGLPARLRFEIGFLGVRAWVWLLLLNLAAVTGRMNKQERRWRGGLDLEPPPAPLTDAERIAAFVRARWLAGDASHTRQLIPHRRAPL